MNDTWTDRKARLEAAMPEIRRLVAAGLSINAAKLYREASGNGLKDSRLAVQEIELEELAFEFSLDRLPDETSAQFATRLAAEINRKMWCLDGKRTRAYHLAKFFQPPA